MNNFKFNYNLHWEKKQVRYISNVMGLSLLSLTFISFVFSIFISLFNIPEIIKKISSSNLILGESILIILDSFIYCVAMFVPFIIIVSTLKISNQIYGLFQKPKGNIGVYAIFIFLGSTILGILSISILVAIFNSFGFQVNSPEMYVPKTLIGMILYLIQLAILPAVFEELLFRGAIMQALRIKGDTFALVLSSLIFSAVHGNFIQIINAFILGMVIGYFVIKTNSLWLGIIMHFLNNGKVVISSLMLENFGELPTVIFTICLNFIFIIIAIICLYFYKKYKLYNSSMPFIKNNSLLTCSNKISISIFTSALLAIFIINLLSSFTYIKFIG